MRDIRRSACPEDVTPTAPARRRERREGERTNPLRCDMQDGGRAGKNLVIARDDCEAPPKYNERGAISAVGWVGPIKDHE